MTDLHDRFARLDEIETEDLWREIEFRFEQEVERVPYPIRRPRRRLVVAGAAAGFVAILVGVALLISSFQEETQPVVTELPGSTSLPGPTSTVPETTLPALPSARLADVLQWSMLTIPSEAAVDCLPGGVHDELCLTPFSAIFQDVTVSDDRLVAVGHDGSTGSWRGAIFSSPDGDIWERETGPGSSSPETASDLHAVTAGPDSVVAVGGTDCGTAGGIEQDGIATCPLIWVSAAEGVWESIALEDIRTADGTPFPRAITAGTFAPDTSYGTATYELYDVAWVRDRFVAIGQAIWTSPDGYTWTMEPLPSSSVATNECTPQCRANGLRHHDDLIIAAGKDPTLQASPRGGKASLWISPDGNEWSQIQPDLPGYWDLMDVVAVGDQYVAVGGYGQAFVIKSDSLDDWSGIEPAPLPGGLYTGATAHEAVVDGERVVAIGDQSPVRWLSEGGAARVWGSLDGGSTWEIYPHDNQSIFGGYYSSTATAEMRAAVLFGDRIVAVGRFNTEAAVWIGTWTD